VVQGDHCLAHLNHAELAQEIARLRDGKTLDARGAHFEEGSLRAVLGELRASMEVPLQLPSSDFTEARFDDFADFQVVEFSDANFRKAQFSGEVDFSEAQFSAGVNFLGAQFEQAARFRGTHFHDAVFSSARFLRETDPRAAQLSADFAHARFKQAAFGGAQFSGATHFDDAQFAAEAAFENAQFSQFVSFAKTRFFGPAGFGEAWFGDTASFDQARFSAIASFVNAQFVGQAAYSHAEFAADVDFERARFSTGGALLTDADFEQANFSADASFSMTEFARDVSFVKSVFRRRVTVGPLLVSGMVRFDDADFEKDVQLDVSAAALSCGQTRFGGRATLNVRWAEVALDGAAFLQPARVAGVDQFQWFDDTAIGKYRVDRRLSQDPRPRLISLRQANVGSPGVLAVANVDLSACRFFGASGLDQLRVEADCLFAKPPRGWRHGDGKYHRRYTRRRTLAEEHHFWQDRVRSGGRHKPDASGTTGRDVDSASTNWYPPECRPPRWLDPPAEPVSAAQIAPLYRALRKALEDRKDEPGAADFYYGEMEMRRRSATWAERSILWFYWLISGYGLRASRAIAALLIMLALLAMPLHFWGFTPGESYGRALLFAAQSSISLLRAPASQPYHETAGGQVVEILLRLAGPLFFGLALLSLRGRVKR